MPKILSHLLTYLRNVRRVVEVAQKYGTSEARVSELERRYDDQRKQHERLEGEVRALNALLVQKEGRAATAEEKARLLQTQVETAQTTSNRR